MSFVSVERLLDKRMESDSETILWIRDGKTKKRNRVSVPDRRNRRLIGFPFFVLKRRNRQDL